MLRSSLAKLLRNESLTQHESQLAMQFILDEASVEQTEIFLNLLQEKGETSGEMLGILAEMQRRMLRVELDDEVIDLVGTGGDGANTINITTGASLLAACCGAKVLKHGSHASTSLCGSADVLKALEITIDVPSDKVNAMLTRHNFAFCYAPNYHPGFKALTNVRRHLKKRTVINLLGPLLNPGNARYLLLGVAEKKYLGCFAEVLQKMSIQRAMVVHGNGLDELSTLGSCDVIEIRQGEVFSYKLDPADYGFHYCQLKALQGGDAHYNSQRLLEVFSGVQSAISDTIILNAAAALMIYGIVEDLNSGIEMVRSQLENGCVMNFIMGLKNA